MYFVWLLRLIRMPGEHCPLVLGVRPRCGPVRPRKDLHPILLRQLLRRQPQRVKRGLPRSGLVLQVELLFTIVLNIHTINWKMWRFALTACSDISPQWRRRPGGGESVALLGGAGWPGLLRTPVATVETLLQALHHSVTQVIRVSYASSYNCSVIILIVS